MLASRLNRLDGRRMRRRLGIVENCDTPRLGNDLRQYLEFLGHEIGEKHRQSGDIAPGLGETCHVAQTDRVGMGGEYDRDRSGRLAHGFNHGRGRRKNDVDIVANQIGC